MSQILDADSQIVLRTLASFSDVIGRLPRADLFARLGVKQSEYTFIDERDYQRSYESIQTMYQDLLRSVTEGDLFKVTIGRTTMSENETRQFTANIISHFDLVKSEKQKNFSDFFKDMQRIYNNSLSISTRLGVGPGDFFILSVGVCQLIMRLLKSNLTSIESAAAEPVARVKFLRATFDDLVELLSASIDREKRLSQIMYGQITPGDAEKIKTINPTPYSELEKVKQQAAEDICRLHESYGATIRQMKIDAIERVMQLRQEVGSLTQQLQDRPPADRFQELEEVFAQGERKTRESFIPIITLVLFLMIAQGAFLLSKCEFGE